MKALPNGHQYDSDRPTSSSQVGRFGLVYRGYNSEGRFTAVQQITNRTKNKEENVKVMFEFNHRLEEFQQRIQLASRDKQNILCIMDHFEIYNHFWIITEYCDQGNISDYMTRIRKDDLAEAELLSIMHGCSSGVEFLHKCSPPIYHGNIKPENVLLQRSTDGSVKVKVADYFVEKVFGGCDQLDSSIVTLSGRRMKYCYRAPEFFPGLVVAQTASYDVFTLGVLFHAMLTYQPGKRIKRLIPNLPDSCNNRPLALLIRPHSDSQEKVTLFGPTSSAKIQAQQDLVEGHMLLYEPEDRCDIMKVTETLASIQHVPDQDQITGIINLEEGCDDKNVYREYTPGIVLGEGVFGWTYQGHRTNNSDEKVTIKILAYGIDTKQRHCLQIPKHKNLNKILRLSRYMFRTWLVTEWCAYNLESYLNSSLEIGLTCKLRIMKDCTAGLLHLHSLDPPVFHGSLKPTNILMKHIAGTGRYVAQLADYAFSSVYEKREYWEGLSIDDISEKNLVYKAPEFFQQKNEDSEAKRLRLEGQDVPVALNYFCVSAESDVFSLGLVFAALLYYKASKYSTVLFIPGFQMDRSIAKQMKERQLFAVDIDLLDFQNLKEVIKQMLDLNTKPRPTIASISDFMKEQFTSDEEALPGTSTQINYHDKMTKEWKLIEKDTNEFEQLETLVDKFSEVLGEDIPDYIQHWNSSTKYFRINVNIDQGKLNEAELFFHQDKFKDYVTHVFITEQKNKPELLASAGCHIYPEVAPGSPLSFVRPETAEHFIQNPQQNGYPTFEYAINRHGGADGFTFGTLAYFADDSNPTGRTFGVTSKHNYDHSTGYNITNQLACMSAYKPYPQNPVTPVCISVRNNVAGLFDKFYVGGVPKLVDIAVFQLHQSIQNHGNMNKYVQQKPGQNGNVRVAPINSQTSDIYLKGMPVHKLGANTEYSSGVIVSTNHRMPVVGRGNGGGVFMVQSRHQGQAFADDGDSGGLVLENREPPMMVNQLTEVSYGVGLIHKKQRDYRVPDTDNDVVDVTFCVRLDHCLDAVQNTFNIRLNICNP